jgi:anti-sigma factor ChrR (cupin superfamily)
VVYAAVIMIRVSPLQVEPSIVHLELLCRLRAEDAADSLAVAQAANDVAVTCVEMGLLDEALVLLQSSLAMRRRHDPCFDTPDIAQGTTAGAVFTTDRCCICHW